MKKLTTVGTMGLALATLVGCTPGEAEFTLKTSEVRKALQGEVAHIRVHEKMTTVLSNAERKVAFGGGKFTNQIDVIKSMVAKVGKHDPFDFSKGAWTNDSVRIWVEEKPNALSCVKLDAQLNIALGTTNALHRYTAGHQAIELCALPIDAGNGKIGASYGEGDDSPYFNVRGAAFWSAIMARGELMDLLFGKENEDLISVDKSLMAVMLPTWFKNLSCVIVGDSDEPLYVIAEDAKVNGKPMEHYEGYVRKGETIHFELNKKIHDNDGGMRFLLKKPEA